LDDPFGGFVTRRLGIEMPRGASEKKGAAASPAPTPGATIDPNAKPSEGFKPYDPELKPAPGGKEHKITIEATEELIEVAPGVKQEMWLFNHTYPGPILRGKDSRSST